MQHAIPRSSRARLSCAGRVDLDRGRVGSLAKIKAQRHRGGSRRAHVIALIDVHRRHERELAFHPLLHGESVELNGIKCILLPSSSSSPLEKYRCLLGVLEEPTTALVV